MLFKDDDGRHIGAKMVLARAVVCLCVAVIIGIILLVVTLVNG